MSARKIASLSAGALLLASCARPAAVAGAHAQEAPPALQAAANAWARAAVARDADSVAAFFAPEAFVMYPQPRPTLGQAANRAAWQRVFAQAGTEHPLTSDTVIVSAAGDLAYSMGRWHLSAPAADSAKAPTDAGGRYLAVWRPIGPAGAWRIVALSANAHRPAPAM